MIKYIKKHRTLQNDLFHRLNGKWGYADLNTHACQLQYNSVNPLLNPATCQSFVQDVHKDLNIDYSFGGYLEDRSVLWNGHYHQSGSFIHLGIDYNVPAGTSVCLPKAAKLWNIIVDEDFNGGWGGRLIFKIKNLFVIFAHLKVQGVMGSGIDRNCTASKGYNYISDNLFEKPLWYYGKTYKKGKVIGRVANYPENGNWYPHLHVQCVSEAKFISSGYKVEDGYSKWYAGVEKDYPDPQSIYN